MKSQLKELIQDFYSYAKNKLNFNKPVRIFLKKDKINASNPLGMTAYYNPDKMSITIFITERHTKDVVRSLAHEIFHHYQHCTNQFPENLYTEEGYAQKNRKLRRLEQEAYEKGNMLFRDWEDNKKLKEKYNENKKKTNEKI